MSQQEQILTPGIKVISFTILIKTLCFSESILQPWQKTLSLIPVDHTGRNLGIQPELRSKFPFHPLQGMTSSLILLYLYTNFWVTKRMYYAKYSDDTDEWFVNVKKTTHTHTKPALSRIIKRVAQFFCRIKWFQLEAEGALLLFHHSSLWHSTYPRGPRVLKTQREMSPIHPNRLQRFANLQKNVDLSKAGGMCCLFCRKYNLIAMVLQLFTNHGEQRIINPKS